MYYRLETFVSLENPSDHCHCDDFPMTVWWLSDDCPMTVQWLTNDCPLTAWWLPRWLSDDHLMTAIERQKIILSNTLVLRINCQWCKVENLNILCWFLFSLQTGRPWKWISKTIIINICICILKKTTLQCQWRGLELPLQGPVLSDC